MGVYKHHMREARKGSLMVSLKNPEKRTCTETSISRSTLRRWILENGDSDAADKGQSTYSGIRIKSTPRDRKKSLTLSKVDFIQFQGRKTKYY